MLQSSAIKIPTAGRWKGWRPVLALPPEVELAFVASCDLPLLAPAFVRRMIKLLGDADVCVPEVDNRLHGLSAVYRRSAAQVRQMLAEDCLRLQSLFERVKTRRVGPDELRDVDPRLESLWNINTPEDLRAAESGLEP